MPRSSLEARVASLEQRLGELLADQARTGRVKDWRRTRGAFTGDAFMKQVFEEGRKIREADRQSTTPKSRMKRPARP